MSTKEEFVKEIKDNFRFRMEERDMRPLIEQGPGEDDFAEWLARHERQTRAVICTTPEFRDTPFCGTGYH